MTISRIIDAACRVTGVNRDVMLSGRRGGSIAITRRTIALLARRYTRLSMTEIAEAVGLRSHSSLSKSLSAVTADERALAADVEALLAPPPPFTATLGGKVIDAAAFYVDLERRMKQPRPGECPTWFQRAEVTPTNTPCGPAAKDAK